MTTHGMHKTKIYQVWCDMKQRCTNSNCSNYQYYGGRGIKVCDEWLNSFEQFYKDMGDIPGKGYSLDRIDNNADYCLENCKWSNRCEQAGNKRNSTKLKLL